MKVIMFIFLSRSSECDVPNIAMESSNFQDDESNNREKNFNKKAYNVSPRMAGCSSSDEEENVRVSGAVARSIKEERQYSTNGHGSENTDFTLEERIHTNAHLNHLKSHKLRYMYNATCKTSHGYLRNKRSYRCISAH